MCACDFSNKFLLVAHQPPMFPVERRVTTLSTPGVYPQRRAPDCAAREAQGIDRFGSFGARNFACCLPKRVGRMFESELSTA